MRERSGTGVVTTAALLLFQAAGAAQAASVDEVIDRYFDARGGIEQFEKIENIRYSGGTYREPNYVNDGHAAMTVARPYYKLVGDKERPGVFMEGYDGSAWEWFEDPGVVLRTVGKASEAIRHYAGVEGPLLDYRAKGSTATYKGAVEFDGRQAHVIELVRRDGHTEVFYFDDETHLLVASGMQAPIHAFGLYVQRLTRISDYREIGGILIPFRFVTVEMPSLRVLDSMQWGHVDVNVDLPDDWFSPPDFERGPTQALIEHLFHQRDDLSAMLWTYHEFRLARPATDTADAVNIAGFQILKMGQSENAIALLQQNVADYPDRADTRYNLGRAYESVERFDEAKTEFQKAVENDRAYKRAQDALDRYERRE